MMMVCVRCAEWREKKRPDYPLEWNRVRPRMEFEESTFGYCSGGDCSRFRARTSENRSCCRYRRIAFLFLVAVVFVSCRFVQCVYVNVCMCVFERERKEKEETRRKKRCGYGWDLLYVYCRHQGAMLIFDFSQNTDIDSWCLLSHLIPSPPPVSSIVLLQI